MTWQSRIGNAAGVPGSMREKIFSEVIARVFSQTPVASKQGGECSTVRRQLHSIHMGVQRRALFMNHIGQQLQLAVRATFAVGSETFQSRRLVGT